MAFWNDRLGCDDIRVERLSRGGTRLGGRWVAAGCPADRSYPDVAYNTKANEYLVVWLEESGVLSSIKAQRLAADGTLNGGQITIFSGAVGRQTAGPPAVAYAFTSDKYLVVWELDVFQRHPVPGMTVKSIAGRSVNSNGSTPSGAFVISQDTGGLARRAPDLAYNRHANSFLTVWQQWDGTAGWDVFGQLVTGDGTILPAFQPIEIAWYIESCTVPVVAAIPTASDAYKYLVVWEAESAAGDHGIYAKMIEEDGTPATSTITIRDTALDESTPAVAGNELGQRYMVTWRHHLGLIDVPVHGRAVDTGGKLLYGEDEFGGSNVVHSAVAAGATGDFLVVWGDQSVFATDADIIGRLWGNRVYLPLTLHGTP